jgi:hypothetical protein
MDILMYLELAKRLESIVRRADTFGPKSREEIMDEIRFVAADLRNAADQIDREMDTRYQQEYA